MGHLRTPAPPRLAPADLADLRAAAPSRTLRPHHLTGAPYILYDPDPLTGDPRLPWAIVQAGALATRTGDPSIAAALLAGESAERGFIARILDPTRDPEEASLDPAGRARLERARNAHAASVRAAERQREAEEAERSRLRRDAERRNAIDVRTLDLDDLLS